MRVLISGGLGFIGSFMVDHCIAQGDEVIVVDDCRSSVIEPGESKADVCLARVQDYDGPLGDVVIHCASPVGSAGVIPERGRIVPEVVETTKKLVERCISEDAWLINISTSEIYGFSGLYSESDDCRVPVRPSARLEYAVAKLAGEFVVMNSIHRGLEAASVRPFNVAGPRQRSDKGFVLPTFVEQARSGEPLTVFGDGLQKRAFTGVTDVCSFVRDFLIPAGHLRGRAFNVGNPANETTILALAERILERFPASIRFTNGKTIHGPDYEEAEGRVKMPHIGRALRLGWEPAVDLDALIEMTVDHYADETVAV